LRDFYKIHEAEFRAWLYRRIDKRTADRYINAINRYLPNGVREPKDLDDIVTKTKYLPLGLRNFLNFLEDQHYIDSFNGFSFALWRKHLPTKSANSRGGKVFITDEHIREALKLIEEKWNDEATTTLYKLLVYSGIRLEHAWRLLTTFDQRLLIIEDDVAMYPIDDLTRGNKRGYFAFMPSDFAETLRKYDILKLPSYKDRLAPHRWKPPIDNPVSPIRIRAWFQNFAIEHGVRVEALRFIVGHSPVTVGEAHYYNMKKIAREEYRKLIGKFPI